MATAVASQPQHGDTEISCGRITLRRDEMNLTLHCIFCELAYEKLELIKNHILRVHAAEIFDTPTLSSGKYSISKEEKMYGGENEGNEDDEQPSLEISIVEYASSDTDEGENEKKLAEELDKKDTYELDESREKSEKPKSNEDDVKMEQIDESTMDEVPGEIENDKEVEKVQMVNEESVKEEDNSRSGDESIVLDVVVERHESTDMEDEAKSEDESFVDLSDEFDADEVMNKLREFENSITVHKICKDSKQLVEPTAKKLKLKAILKEDEEEEEEEFQDDVKEQTNKTVNINTVGEQNETVESEELDDLLCDLEETITISSADEAETSTKGHAYAENVAPSKPPVEIPLNDAQTLKLIEFLKADKSLWHKDHLHDTKTRNMAIARITAQLNTDADAEKHVQDRTVRAKIHKLKLLYRCYESLGERNSDESLYEALSFLRGHQPPKPWKCEVCTELVTGMDVKTHNAKHKTDATGGKCVMCKLELPSQCYVVPHMTTHRIYICELCNRDDFRTVLSYRTHYEELHPNLPVPLSTHKPFQMTKCEYCDSEFSTRIKYKEHLVEYHHKNPYSCPSCELSFNTALELAVHFNMTHNDALQRSRKAREEREAAVELKRKSSELRKAQIEEKKQERINKVKQEEKPKNDTESEQQEFECEFCYHAPFANAHDLEHHRNTEHRGIPKFIASTRWHSGSFKCPHCDVVSRTSAERLAHIDRQHYFRYYDQSDSCVCEFCGKNFDLPNGLRRHRKEMHLEVGMYKCKLCNAAYNTTQRLKLHVNSAHTKRPKHLCPICTSGFYAKRYLNQHTWHVHKIPPPFKCDQCVKEMFSMKALESHKKKRHKKDEADEMDETTIATTMDETKDEL